MRITAFMLYRQFTTNLSKNLSKLGTRQEQLSSGKKLTNISDDVVASRGAMSYKVSINNIEQFKRNIDEGVSQLGFTESLLSSTENILNRARELSVSMNNDTATRETRELASYEVQNLYTQLIDIGNSKLGNKYVFSGFKTSTKAFDANGNYQGDSNDFEVYITEGIKTKVNMTGDRAFSDNTKYITDDLTGQTLNGSLKITSGTGNPMIIPGSAFAFNNASPEDIRETINAPMTDFYADDSAVVGTGKLTFKVGTDDAQTIDVNAVNGNTTVPGLVNYINANVTGVDAGIAYENAEGPASRVKIYLKPSSPDTSFTVNISDDGDGNDSDTGGLSALLHTGLRSNLSTESLGIEAFVMNGGFGKKLLFSPTVANTDFKIEIDENNNGVFGEAGEIDDDASGLSLLYRDTDTSMSLNKSVSYFTVLDNLRYSLANNDRKGIDGSIYLLDGSIDNLVDVMADTGSRLKYLDEQKNRLEDNKVAYQTSRSALEDADIAEVAMEITKIQSALESMRISSLRSLTQSLMDFLN